MARIVLISPYLKGGQNAAKLAQRTRYVATRPGVELLVDERSTLPATKKQQEFIARLLKSFPSCWELIEYEEYLDHPTQGSASAFIQQVQEDYMEALEQKENFIDYISHRPGVQKDGEHGLWDAHGKVRNLAQAVREVAEHSGNVWTPVVALRREDAERLGYDSAENWQALVNASICDIAKAYKIRPENLRWYAAFHQKPNQVHIHMIIFSADSKEGYRKGWLNETALSAPNIQLCRGALLKSAFAAAKIPVYDSVLYESGVSLPNHENCIRIGKELQLCGEEDDANEIVTRRDAAMLLHAILTRAFTVTAPAAPVTLVNAAGVNINDYLLALRQVPEPVLAAFNAAGWTYRIDFDYISELSKQLNMSC
ncbi:MAG: relaxase MobL, partial [Ruthenibacterium lactatiformans]|nr:relaxase MobL [Ruthenibacterium lactatiformans]